MSRVWFIGETYAPVGQVSLVNRGVPRLFHHGSDNVTKNRLQAAKAPSA
jgi:hypothetical protein